MVIISKKDEFNDNNNESGDNYFKLLSFTEPSSEYLYPDIDSE